MYDDIIIDGGSAGCVLEAGLNGRRAYPPRGKVLVGGSSSVNAVIYTRGHPRDDDWAAQGKPGWAGSDVLPFFQARRAQRTRWGRFPRQRRPAQREGSALPEPPQPGLRVGRRAGHAHPARRPAGRGRGVCAGRPATRASRAT